MLICIQSKNLNCTELLKTRMGARAYDAFYDVCLRNQNPGVNLTCGTDS